MKFHKLLGATVVAAAALLSLSALAGPATGYRIIARYQIGGSELGYDYLRVDAPMRRVFVAHANRVEVLSTENGNRVGEIIGMHGVHGIEIIPELGKGYTSNGLDRTVSVFDRSSLQVKKVIAYTGVKPDAIQYDPDTKRIYIVNGGSTGDVTIIDPATDSIVETLALGGAKLEQIGFDGRGHAFVNDEGKSVIHVFDTHTLRPLGTWTLGGCEEPTGMAVDQAHHRVFAACGNRELAVLDTDSGRVIATPAIGQDPDGAVFDPKTQRIFTSNKEGTLSVVHESTPDRYETVQTLKTEPGARTLAMDEDTGRIYMPTAKTTPAPSGGGAPSIIPDSFVLLVAGQ
jgi:DNA-binding beta-propeller fold protein YncE